MWKFILKYKAFLFGGFITWGIVKLLSYKKLILIDENNIVTNILSFSFYWFLISLFIHKFQYIKSKIHSINKILGIVIILLIVLLIRNDNSPDNPILVLFFTIIYLLAAFIVTPNFFKKYRIGILSFYCIIYAIFLYFRVFSGNSELYEYFSPVIFISFIIPIPILLGMWSYEQWKWFQILKAEKASAELSMLQAQINPHFFFNTLNNLYALTLKKSDQAPGVILKLSDMMRYTIYEGKKDIVDIEEEIDYLTNYIELHKIRHKKRVKISFKHNVLNHSKVAPLLFIIPVENAFKHGVESISDVAFVSIDLTEKEGYFHFKVENNFDPNNQSESEGIGLENLKRRLELFYKNDYEIKTATAENNTYIFTLKIPAHA